MEMGSHRAVQDQTDPRPKRKRLLKKVTCLIDQAFLNTIKDRRIIRKAAAYTRVPIEALFTLQAEMKCL